MPPFPERESSILAKLKKKRPDKVSVLLEPKAPGRSSVTDNNKTEHSPSGVFISAMSSVQNHVCYLLLTVNQVNQVYSTLQYNKIIYNAHKVEKSNLRRGQSLGGRRCGRWLARKRCLVRLWMMLECMSSVGLPDTSR